MGGIQRLWGTLVGFFTEVYWLLYDLFYGNPCEEEGCGCSFYDDSETFRKLSEQSGDPMYPKHVLDSGIVGTPLKCDRCEHGREAHARLAPRVISPEHMPNGGAVLVEQTSRKSLARRAARFPAALTAAKPAEPKTTWKDETEGEGAEVQSGTEVLSKYVACFKSDGKAFETNSEFRFKVGSAQVVPGIDEGVRGMRAGGTRVVTVPPHLAYGAKKNIDGRIGETLVFTLSVLAAVNP